LFVVVVEAILDWLLWLDADGGEFVTLEFEKNRKFYFLHFQLIPLRFKYDSMKIQFLGKMYELIYS